MGNSYLQSNNLLSLDLIIILKITNPFLIVIINLGDRDDLPLQYWYIIKKSSDTLEISKELLDTRDS